MDKKVLIVGLVAVGLIFVIGSAAAVQTVHLGGNVNDEVTLQGRNLPECVLGIGPQEEVTIWEQTTASTRPVHLGIGPQEEVTFGMGGPQEEVTLGIGPQETVHMANPMTYEEAKEATDQMILDIWL
jgi:hypothetical protein